MKYNFAVFILSHNRANSMTTIDALKRSNYTGRYYVVIDNEDKEIETYLKLYGNKVIIFDKTEYSKHIDSCDLIDDRCAIVYARNKCFDLAEEMCIDYFLELDDDFTKFEYRRPRNGHLKHIVCKQLDVLFERMIDFLEETHALTVTLSQGGDFIGGEESKVYKDRLARKAMNTFFCKTSNRINFLEE